MTKILLIEDDEQLREMVRLLLTEAGYLVSLARDGIEGIRRHRTDPADLVLTDIVMPNKEGLETIIELRREYPDLRIVAMSGSTYSPTWLKTARLLGVQRTLLKPFTIPQLTGAIAEVLADRRAGT